MVETRLQKRKLDDLEDSHNEVSDESSVASSHSSDSSQRESGAEDDQEDTESLVSVDEADQDEMKGWIDSLLDDPDYEVETSADGEHTITLNYKGLLDLLEKANPGRL